MTGFVVALQDGIPFAADPTPVGGRAVLTAFIVVGLLAGLAYYLRRGLPVSRLRQVITVETAVSLGDRRSLVVVSVESRRLLLGLTPQQISLITELGPPEAAAFPEKLQASLAAGERS